MNLCFVGILCDLVPQEESIRRVLSSSALKAQETFDNS